MDSKTKVYGKPGCPGCKMTVKVLEKQGTPYEYADISTNEVAHQEVKNLGYVGVPVVVTETEHWYGFSPDRLRNIKRG